MHDYDEIRRRFNDGESQRHIAKTMGISRNTVKKYCEGNAVPWERKTPERVSSVLTEETVGQRMNYHSHEHRDEVWTIISGSSKTIVDGMEQKVGPGDVITMDAGCKHIIIADTELQLIEVQLGKEISVKDKHKYELNL